MTQEDLTQKLKKLDRPAIEMQRHRDQLRLTLLNARRSATLGGLLIMLPVLFLLAVFLKYGLGIGFAFDRLDYFFADPKRLRIFNWISPVIFLGGALLALILNTLAVLHIEVRRAESSLVSTITIKGKLWNIAIIVMSFVLLAVFATYAFVENFTLVAR